MAKNNDGSYTPSALAEGVSKAAGMFLIGGILVLFLDGEFDIEYLPMTLILCGMGFGLMWFSNYLRFQKLFRFYRENGYEEQFKASRELCVKIYNANPCKRVLNYIMKLNPEAGKSIAEQLANAKK